MEADKALQDLLLEMLDSEYFQTTTHLVESLRVEHQEQYRSLMDSYADRYKLGGCGALMGPLTAVSSALQAMAANSLVERVTDNGVIMWRLARVSGGLSP